MKLAELDSELEKQQLSGFWRTRVPSHSPEAPYLWKWEPLLDGLYKASETIGIEKAERRAIRLVSPHLPIKSTSHTLQFTFSIVNPGEIAKAHRHNMAAIRFVVQGRGAYTVVDGEKFPMAEGDLILTPNWTWHEHHNESEDPIIWLDGLDGPLIQSFNILFFEESETAEQPIDRDELIAALRRTMSKQPRRVLIVDDTPDARDLLSSYLAEEGAEIRTAGDGVEALRVLESYTPDLVLLDLLMPNLDGIAVIKKLNESEPYRSIPIIVRMFSEKPRKYITANVAMIDVGMA